MLNCKSQERQQGNGVLTLGGHKNQDFWPNINILQGNYCILSGLFFVNRPTECKVLKMCQNCTFKVKNQWIFFVLFSFEYQISRLFSVENTFQTFHFLKLCPIFCESALRLLKVSWIQYPQYLWSIHKITSVSKKLGQSAVLYYYCASSQFF